MTRRYVQALVQHREREVLIGGLWEITGFKQVSLVIDKAVKGSTTYSIRRRITIVVNAVTSFSNKPLVLIFYLGSLISLLSLLAASYLVVRRIFFGELLTGWPSLIVSIWLLGGLTILCLGVIGIYLAKIFTEVKQRPYTIIRCMYDHRTYAADMALTRTPEYVNDYTVS
jgi:putative glycosyltransferase